MMKQIERNKLLKKRDYEMDQYLRLLTQSKIAFEEANPDIPLIDKSLKRAREHLRNAATYARKIK